MKRRRRISTGLARRIKGRGPGALRPRRHACGGERLVRAQPLAGGNGWQSRVPSPFACAVNTTANIPTGTSTLHMFKTLHISTSLNLLYKSYSLATLKHSRPFLLEIYLGAVVITSDLKCVLIYSKREFLYVSTITLLSPLILIKDYI